MIKFDVQKKLKAAHGDMLLHAQSQIEQGKLVVLYGPSGAGKTSILRMLAGLMKPEAGFIEVNETRWYDHERALFLSPQQRGIGFVFQNYALFPNMTVRENLTYALRKDQSPDVIDELMETVELHVLQDRKPETLSGGQQQRVALARALVRRPEILLLDEPLSALDQSIRSKLQDYILQAHRQFGLTTILVSHDLGEVFKMAEEVLVLDKGTIVKSGSPQTIFAGGGPANNFVKTAIVLAIEAEGILSVLIDNQVLQIRQTDLEQVTVGEEVLLSWQAGSGTVRRLNKS